jgi:uncharacterized protein YigE (DUF2233 family)
MANITRRAVIAASTLATPAFADLPSVAWRTLAPGLDHGQARITARIGDGQLHIARIDPAHFRFTLLTAAGTHSARKTARQWARQNGCVAAINAAMFRPNGLPVGFAKVDGQVLQTHHSSDRSVFVFNGDHARLLDLACETFDENDHQNALQGIRMISCTGANVWSQQERRWSIAALGQDGEGRILFLHARSPLSVHDFIAAVQGMPLGLTRAMYLEGGPEATFYLNAGGAEIERVGSYETGFNENDDNAGAWPLPNVIGVIPRQ